jgi:hypothetical protein
MKNGHNEFHIVQFPAGHEMSSDCWCEPSLISWGKNRDGDPILLIRHHDDTNTHHTVMLDHRNHKHDWITRMLDTINEPPIG